MSKEVNFYRRLFDYEKDAHSKVLASLRAAANDKQFLPEFHKAVELFGHIVAARRLWLYRFGKLSEEPREFFPNGLSLDALEKSIEETQSLWAKYFELLDEAELARVFEYRSLEGPRFRNSIEDVLIQLFGHSLYHRGQIAMLLRSCGAEPATTDFVYWTREPLPNEWDL
ncbi:MAG TPA: DinB family protein [Blastocatellia bacterium]|nr:DinB family protein [Blastocatellia bacterium]